MEKLLTKNDLLEKLRSYAYTPDDDVIRLKERVKDMIKTEFANRIRQSVEKHGIDDIPTSLISKKKKELVNVWEDVLNIPQDREHYTGMISLKEIKDISNKEKWNDIEWLIKDRGYKIYHKQKKKTIPKNGFLLNNF